MVFLGLNHRKQGILKMSLVVGNEVAIKSLDTRSFMFFTEVFRELGVIQEM